MSDSLAYRRTLRAIFIGALLVAGIIGATSLAVLWVGLILVTYLEP